MLFSTTLIGVIFFYFLGGEFWNNLSYLFYNFISLVSTIIVYCCTMCVVDGLRMDGLVRVVGTWG